MEHLLGQDWEITPAGGATGEAFFAKKDNEMLFLKRNSSPFLAVLSAEGIVPKLIWTKRMENGDVITAQQCLIGREFKPREMAQERAAKLLRKIHESRPLLSMLMRLGKTPYEPIEMVKDIESKLDADLLQLNIVKKVITFLKKEIPNIKCDEWAVCHGDVNHNNWLLSDDNELYLIDWDGAMIADPALDLGLLLHWYIPKEDWDVWLKQYGLNLTKHLELRMKWYTLAQTLQSIQWLKSKDRMDEVEFWMDFISGMEFN